MAIGYFFAAGTLTMAVGAWGGPFGYYPTYHETDSILTSLQQKYPDIVKRFALAPQTLEKRDLYAVKISSSPNIDNRKPEALISGVQHAAEPIGAAIIRDDLILLCEKYAIDPEVKWLVDNRQIYFVPIMNPDGFEYIREDAKTRQMWRKNRRKNADGSFGVDLNRNYPFKWGHDNTNSSPDPKAMNYRGPSAASEPETKAMIDFIEQHRFRTWQNHHSPNEVLVIPFGYDWEVKLPPQDELAYRALCTEQAVHYPRFIHSDGMQCGPSFIVYDGWALNGGTEDWGWSKGVYTIISETGKGYWEDEPTARAVAQSMRWADLSMIQSAGFFPLVKSIALTDSCSACNRNGIANPGETVRLAVEIRNQSVVDTTPVQGFLGSASPHLAFPDSSGGYGGMRPLAVMRNDADAFTVTVAPGAPPGTKIPMRLRLTWELKSVTYEKILPCTLSVGPAVSPIQERAVSPGAFAYARREKSPPGWLRFTRPPSLARPGQASQGFLEIHAFNRLIRVLRPASGADGQVAGGPSPEPQFLWDLADGSGMRVSPGVYFAVWVFPGSRISTRFALTE